MDVDPPHLSGVPAAAGAQRAEPVVETVPAEVREAARRAFAERDRQAQVLPLTYDSLLADTTADQPRRLTFTAAGGVEATVTVHPSSSGESVQVEVTSVGCSLVEVTCGETRFVVDTPGGAVVGPAPHGLFSAVLRGEDDRRLRTSWVRV